MNTAAASTQRTIFGHPTGLFMLFFAEMWERFSYYGMRALLVLYMIKGFLQYGDKQAYAVYGAYTALVYATPFIGGMLADRILGQRRAVIIGGLLMAAGHAVMAVEGATPFYIALSLVILGNGFFKPNISTMVGSLYPVGSPKRDGGFTIFYMGVNLGAALSPLLCGYIGEKYGWHYGFGLATIGMLIGLATFIMPTRITQLLIGAGALLTSWSLYKYNPGGPQTMAVNMCIAGALLLSAVAAIAALSRGGFPSDVGQPKDTTAVRKCTIPGVPNWLAILLGTALLVPGIAFVLQDGTLATKLLSVFGGLAFLSLIVTAFRSEKVERQRLFVVLILMFFSMTFWAFFEQAGSSLNNFADRNVDIVINDKELTAADIGTEVKDAPLTQEFLGVEVAGKRYTLQDISAAEKARDDADPATVGTVSFRVTEAHVGMGIGGEVLKASVFQAVNPMCILIFGLVLTMLWGVLAARGLEPSTPIKFGFGLLQLGLGFGALWYGAKHGDRHGFCGMEWLLLGYLLHTTGELCISPVGLSMVTKLSPAKMVSTVMGGWFLSMAFSNDLASKIAQLTAVGGGEDGPQVIPPPTETIGIYGGVFGQIALYAMGAGVLVMLLAPLLKSWMHEDPAATKKAAGH